MLKNWKKALTVLACVCVVFAMAVCFADTTTGAEGFIAAMTDSTTGITGANLWTSLIPFVPLLVAVFIFAFAYGRVRKSTSSASKGKFRM